MPQHKAHKGGKHKIKGAAKSVHDASRRAGAAKPKPKSDLGGRMHRLDEEVAALSQQVTQEHDGPARGGLGSGARGPKGGGVAKAMGSKRVVGERLSSGYTRERPGAAKKGSAPAAGGAAANKEAGGAARGEKGPKGAGGKSKQGRVKGQTKGFEERRSKLLPEYVSAATGKSNVFVDMRKKIRAKNPILGGTSLGPAVMEPTETERLLRWHQERFAPSKAQVRAARYNLTDGDEDVGDISFTHGGKPLDYNALPEVQAEEEDNDLSADLVSKAHFGGGDEDDKRKSAKDVYDEIIAKSKLARAERAKDREQRAQLTAQLDDEFSQLQGFSDLLARRKKSDTPNEPDPTPATPTPSTTSTGATTTATTQTTPSVNKDAEYDQLVRELTFESTAPAADKVKSPVEIAKMQQEQLRKLEQQRLERMKSEGMDEARWTELAEAERILNDNTNPSKKDKFNAGAWGTALDVLVSEKFDENKTSKKPEDDTQTRRRVLTDLDIRSLQLPFNFDTVPKNLEEYADIIKSLPTDQHELVARRIFIGHHPTLKPQNTSEIAVFFSVLLERFYVSGTMEELNSLTRVLLFLSKELEPYTSTSHELAQKNKEAFEEADRRNKIELRNRQQRGEEQPQTPLPPLRPAGAPAYAHDHLKRIFGVVSKLHWPTVRDFLLLKLFSDMFSCTDMRHSICTPAMLILSQSLCMCPIRNTGGIISGFLACTTLLHYIKQSHKFVPEVLNFLACILHLLCEGLPSGQTSEEPEVLAGKKRKNVEEAEIPDSPDSSVTLLNTNFSDSETDEPSSSEVIRRNKGKRITYDKDHIRPQAVKQISDMPSLIDTSPGLLTFGICKAPPPTPTKFQLPVTSTEMPLASNTFTLQCLDMCLDLLLLFEKQYTLDTSNPVLPTNALLPPLYHCGGGVFHTHRQLLAKLVTQDDCAEGTGSEQVKKYILPTSTRDKINNFLHIVAHYEVEEEREKSRIQLGFSTLPRRNPAPLPMHTPKLQDLTLRDKISLYTDTTGNPEAQTIQLKKLKEKKRKELKLTNKELHRDSLFIAELKRKDAIREKQEREESKRKIMHELEQQQCETNKESRQKQMWKKRKVRSFF
ncbi:nucleolar protein 14 [Pelomyxa schiedti]|nr:nucleolar protein 14 [Pelomyxa schiedti]